MRILVTGARGLLGRTCLSRARPAHELLGVDVEEMDVTDREAVAGTLSDERPEAVLHCAAYTDVDGAEVDSERAMTVNADGAEWVAQAAQRVGAVMVYVSTDYVFDGRSTRPYNEEDRPNPLSRYGASKRAGEERVARACAGRYIIVRTAWLYGDGAGFADWVLKGLDSGKMLRLVTDHRGSPTLAGDLAEALFRLLEQGRRGVYHFANRGETSWLEWGHAIAEMTGRADVVFETVTADELGRVAPRPRYSVLAVEKYERATGARAPTWQDALKRFLASTGRLR